MINLEYLKIEAQFKYLWLKSVRDIDLMQHCARCLIGEYDNRISPRISVIENLELTGDVYYLCGVSQSFIWANNFHLAFMESTGSQIDCSRNGIVCRILNAKELPICTDFIDQTHPKAKFASYSTCRNWQFAHWFNANLKQP